MKIKAEVLTAQAFAPYGELIEPAGQPDMIINQGMCGRYHDLAKLDFADGRAGISLFDARACAFPYDLDLVERHPLGSQAFIPVNGVPFLVTVAADADGTPVNIRAFVTSPGQSVNLHRNIWHGVLAPIGSDGQYVVIDRIGEGENLQEHWFQTPVQITEV